MKSLAKNVLAAAGFALLIFGVGIFRETQVDGRPLRTAVGTASLAAGIVFLLLLAGIFFVTRQESAKAAVRSGADDAALSATDVSPSEDP